MAVKWILPEDGHDRATRILEKYQDEELDLVAPYLVVSEVANVLWKRQRRGDLTEPRPGAASNTFSPIHRYCSIRRQ